MKDAHKYIIRVQQYKQSLEQELVRSCVQGTILKNARYGSYHFADGSYIDNEGVAHDSRSNSL